MLSLVGKVRDFSRKLAISCLMYVDSRAFANFEHPAGRISPGQASRAGALCHAGVIRTATPHKTRAARRAPSFPRSEYGTVTPRMRRSPPRARQPRPWCRACGQHSTGTTNPARSPATSKGPPLVQSEQSERAARFVRVNEGRARPPFQVQPKQQARMLFPSKPFERTTRWVCVEEHPGPIGITDGSSRYYPVF